MNNYREFNCQLKELEKNLLTLKGLNLKDYDVVHILKWFNEVVCKNIIIFKSKFNPGKQDVETFSKYKNHVYWIDFGKNIGTEIHDYHYAVVIKELDCIAIVVPLTTKKTVIPDWMKNNDLIVDIGEVTGFPKEDKECYANVSGIQSISKKRLDRCGNKANGYFDIILTTPQMKLIYNNIVSNIINEETVDNANIS